MATGRQLYDACCQFLGEPYSTAPGRTSPTSGYKDCSGLVAAGFEVAQGYELGAYVSVTIFQQAQRNGLVIPFAYAANIVGACIFKPENPELGWGAAGHIAVSDGRGGTVEATPPRVQRLGLGYNAPWSSQACLLPALDYSNSGEGGAAPPAATTGGNSVFHMITDGPAPNNPRTFKVDGLQIIGEIPYGDPRGAFAIHQEALDAQAKYGIPIIDGRATPPFCNEPLFDLVKSYSGGAWLEAGGAGGGPVDYQKIAETTADELARRAQE